MEQISIIFSKSNKWYGVYSKLIMWAERVPYSHVAIKMIDSETKQTIIFQASGTIVNEVEESEFLSQEILIQEFKFDVSPDLKFSAKMYAISNLGKPYGTLSALGLAVVQVASWLGLKIKNPFSDGSRSFVCSEFIASLLKNVDNIDLPDTTDDMTPAKLFDVVKNLPSTLKSGN